MLFQSYNANRIAGVLSLELVRQVGSVEPILHRVINANLRF